MEKKIDDPEEKEAETERSSRNKRCVSECQSTDAHERERFFLDCDMTAFRELRTADASPLYKSSAGTRCGNGRHPGPLSAGV